MGFSSSKQSSTGNSQSTSASLNQAYPSLNASLGGQTSNVGTGSSALRQLLGLEGDSGASQAFQTFKDSSGYNFIRDEGMRGINSNNASKGLLGSGSALKAISGYNNNLASTYLEKYMSSLLGLSNIGLQSGQILSAAGNTANSQSTSVQSSSGKSTNLSFG